MTPRTSRLLSVLFFSVAIAVVTAGGGSPGTSITPPVDPPFVPTVDVNDTRLLAQPAVSANHVAFIYAADLWVARLDGTGVRRLTTESRSHRVVTTVTGVIRRTLMTRQDVIS